jgi:hypothetical protein
MFERTFDLAEYEPDTPFSIGKLAVTPTRVPHYRLETYAFRVQSNGAVLTYSGDSAPSDELVEAARDADLFVCEATLLRGELDGSPEGTSPWTRPSTPSSGRVRSGSSSRTAHASSHTGRLRARVRRSHDRRLISGQHGGSCRRRYARV